MLNFNKYDILTFDCYGTLIDWENGILTALKPVLVNHNINLNDDAILELYAKFESDIEKGEFLICKNVLGKIMERIGNKFEFDLSSSEKDCLVESLRNWKPFPDTSESLQLLKNKFKLAIISNIDDDLFAYSEKQIGVNFDYVITAEQVCSYKPALDNFEFAIRKIGVSPDKILHVAQSIYHDIIPAKTVGLSTVWVNRRKGKKGFGATPPASGQADLEVSDLKELVQILGL